MTIQTGADIRDGYIYLSCTGTYSSDSLERVFEEGFAIAKDHGLMVVLVDARGLGGPTPSIMERFFLAERLAKMQKSLFPLINMVVVGDEPFVSLDKFGETVALNRGAIGKVFTDIGEAVIWIEELNAKRKEH
jgi:hypothetical protein